MPRVSIDSANHPGTFFSRRGQPSTAPPKLRQVLEVSRITHCRQIAFWRVGRSGGSYRIIRDRPRTALKDAVRYGKQFSVRLACVDELLLAREIRRAQDDANGEIGFGPGSRKGRVRGTGLSRAGGAGGAIARRGGLLDPGRAGARGATAGAARPLLYFHA